MSIPHPPFTTHRKSISISFGFEEIKKKKRKLPWNLLPHLYIHVTYAQSWATGC